MVGSRSTVWTPPRCHRVAASATWTLRDMDHIYVLDHGAIVEQGRYEDLISANGRFAEIFASQT